jgi:hypothetical protein
MRGGTRGGGWIRWPGWRAIPLGAVAASLAGLALWPGTGISKPPDWWVRETRAGPPLWQPQTWPDPPLSIGIRGQHFRPSKYGSFFHGELGRTLAEKVVLQDELGQLGGGLARTPLEEIFGELAKRGAQILCPEWGGAVEVYGWFERARKGTETLNLVEKLSRLKEDEEYIRWLDYWYVRYDPRAYRPDKNGSVIWNSHKKWERNPKSPFNRDRLRWQTLYETMISADTCCPSSGNKLSRAHARAHACTAPSPPPPPAPGTEVSCGSQEADQLRTEGQLAELDFDVGVPGQMTVTPPGQTLQTPSGGAYHASFCYVEPVTVTLTFVPGSGYQFTGWIGVGNPGGNPGGSLGQACSNDRTNQSPTCTIVFPAGNRYIGTLGPTESQS